MKGYYEAKDSQVDNDFQVVNRFQAVIDCHVFNDSQVVNDFQVFSASSLTMQKCSHLLVLDSSYSFQSKLPVSLYVLMFSHTSNVICLKAAIHVLAECRDQAVNTRG